MDECPQCQIAAKNSHVHTFPDLGVMVVCEVYPCGMVTLFIESPGFSGGEPELLGECSAKPRTPGPQRIA